MTNKTIVIYCNIDNRMKTPDKEEIIQSLHDLGLEVFRIQIAKSL